VGDENNLLVNSGKNKRYPQGPVCTVDGVNLPTYCCASENVSITVELLVGMLADMDKTGIFARDTAWPTTFLNS
jgi:hypothetical protein